MPDPIPGPSTGRAHAAPTLIGDTGAELGVLLHTTSELDVTPKMKVTDTFTNLNNWVTVYGEPEISSGNLAGEGIVRHKTQALTDSHKASAVIGSASAGKTRLVICADEAFGSYYAVEIENHSFTSDNVNFIKGVPGSSVEAAPGLLGILNSILALLFGILSIFSGNVTPAATTTSTTLGNGDEFSIWFDEPNTTVRIYKNDSAILNVAVPRGEIPHGPGYQWHGCAVGVDGTGPLLTSYECEDI